MLHDELCMCDEFAPLETRTRLVVIMHRREAKKNTNTARVALRTLTNAEVMLRGVDGAPLDLPQLEDSARRVLVLFPREDAGVLTAELVAADPRPVTLVVPDGTWSQARRLMRRESWLASAEAVLPPPGPPTRYHLRRETATDGLATAEAIARAMGVLEGAAAQAEIERVFDIMVARTLATRGT